MTEGTGRPADPLLAEDDSTAAGYLQGDRQAVALVDGWIRMAAGPFRQRLGADWPDLLQEARLEMLRLLRQSSWRREARLRTYVWRVVGHTCLDAMRRQKRRPVHEPEEAAPPLPSGEPSPLDRLVEADAARRLVALLESLPQDCRDLWQRILRGASYGEISRDLGIAEGALRVRAHRCRKRAAGVLAGNAERLDTAEG